MKLATLNNGHRDGRLVVVSRDLAWTPQGPGLYFKADFQDSHGEFSEWLRVATCE